MNVLGAIDALTHEIVTVINDTSIGAVNVVDLIAKIALQNMDIPQTIVLDNAKYQYCVMVKRAAAYYNVELLYLPSYSPNLNIIERLWKWIKKDCLYCKYYSNFADFKKAIVASLNKCQLIECKSQMSTLFRLKFQMYDNAQIMTL